MGKVWLASHLERKLSKSALLQTSIPSSVDAILSPEHVSGLALRLSGQLLLGVARIYSRKAKYLMDDCSDALVKIKVAFRSGNAGGGAAGADGVRGGRANVDMPDDPLEGARINININDGQGRGIADFDMLYNAEFGGFGMWDDFNLNPMGTPAQSSKKGKSNTVSKQADITLREDHSMYGDEDDDPYNRPLDLGDGGFGSQEFRPMSVDGGELDLGLDLDLELDLGLMDDEEAARLDREDSPAVTAVQRARQQSGVLRVGDFAAQAGHRSSSEAPSVELGRDAQQHRSHQDSIAADVLGGIDGLDKSVLDGPNDSTLGSDPFDAGLGPMNDDTHMDLDLGGGLDLDLGLDDGQCSEHTARSPMCESDLPSSAPRASSPVKAAVALDAGMDAVNTSAEIESANDGDATLQDVELTPRTANKIAEAAAANSASKKRAAAKSKAPKVHKAIVDEQTELAPRARPAGGDSQSQSQSTTLGAITGGLGTKEERMAQGLIKKPVYLASTVIQIRLQEIHKNPKAHFFPGMGAFSAAAAGKENETFYAGPPGLPKQLQGLFSFQIGKNGTVLGAKRPAQPAAAAGVQSKRARSATAQPSEAAEVELGRERQSSFADGFEPPDFGAVNGEDDFGLPGMDSSNDFQLQLEDQNPALDIADVSRAMLDKTPTSSRMGSVAPLDASLNLDLDAIDRARNSMLAVFDSASKASQSQQAVTSTPLKRKRDGMASAPGTRATPASLDEQEETQASTLSAANGGRGRTGGWSRNTVKALKILEHELGPADEAEEDKKLSFNGLADKASRKAAASMFFEMLILGTRDCVKLEQKKPYADVSVQAKPKLWEVCEGLNDLSMATEAAQEQDSREATPLAVPSSARSSRVARSVSVVA